MKEYKVQVLEEREEGLVRNRRKTHPTKKGGKLGWNLGQNI